MLGSDVGTNKYKKFLPDALVLHRAFRVMEEILVGLHVIFLYLPQVSARQGLEIL